MVGVRTLALTALLTAIACGSGGGGGAAVTQASGAVEIPGALFLDSRGSILSVPEVNAALRTVSFPINSGNRPPTIEGTYSFQFRYARHTVDNSHVGVAGTMELVFHNQRLSEIDYTLGVPGDNTVVNGFINGGGASFPGQPSLEDDFTVVGVITSSESFLGLPCRERDAIVISGRIDEAGDLKLRMLVMTVRVEADCIAALVKAGFNPESIPGAHVIVLGDAIRVGP